MIHEMQQEKVVVMTLKYPTLTTTMQRNPMGQQGLTMRTQVQNMLMHLHLGKIQKRIHSLVVQVIPKELRKKLKASSKLKQMGEVMVSSRVITITSISRLQRIVLMTRW